MLRRLAAWPYWAGIALAGLGVVFLLLSQWERRSASAREGVLRARIAQLQRDSSALAHRAAKTDTAFMRDTIRLTRAVSRYRTLRDTINLRDTLEVVRTLAAADTAIRA